MLRLFHPIHRDNPDQLSNKNKILIGPWILIILVNRFNPIIRVNLLLNNHREVNRRSNGNPLILRYYPHRDVPSLWGPHPR
jgi:hypothetical protein